ncbi:uncharacterized protein LOC114932455 [Nylanderia fulva]|uniref:uncharacterized protein LOC114932455 n=1 Tax=Nylanderia fulva TaxID=613905 RepID=UPI0010FADB5C|nr:uncharacterized protein LOC114932455 [Nylanderia fulva]
MTQTLKIIIFIIILMSNTVTHLPLSNSTLNTVYPIFDNMQNKSEESIKETTIQYQLDIDALWNWILLVWTTLNPWVAILLTSIILVFILCLLYWIRKYFTVFINCSGFTPEFEFPLKFRTRITTIPRRQNNVNFTEECEMQTVPITENV